MAKSNELIEGQNIELTSGISDVKLTFNQNRSFELKIGRQYFPFQPYESQVFTGTILQHKDFTEEIKKFFTIEILN